MQHPTDILSTPRMPSQPGQRIAFIQAGWPRDIVDQCRLGFIAEMEALGRAAADIDFYEVAGAFEIPLHARLLATAGRHAAIVAAGLVVDGGIYRHDFVSGAVIDALMRVQLDSGVPVMSAVLTPRDFHEHDEHHRFFSEHFVKKGVEVARACLETIAGLRRVEMALAA